MATELAEKIQSQIDSLKQATSRLKEATSLEPIRIHKDATIQRFNFCFELGWKLMQSIAQFQGEESYSPRNCIRTAVRLGLIDDPEKWFGYLEARNLTAHLYDEKIADLVYEKAKEFLTATQSLIVTAEKVMGEEK